MRHRWLWVDIERRLHLGERVTVYLDLRDWWIGVYRGEHSVFVCPLPTVVIRFQRKGEP